VDSCSNYYHHKPVLILLVWLVTGLAKELQTNRLVVSQSLEPVDAFPTDYLISKLDTVASPGDCLYSKWNDKILALERAMAGRACPIVEADAQ
jgi:hypothetical protein